MDNTKQDNTNQQSSPSQQQTEQVATPLPSSAPSKTFMILIVLILIMAIGVGGFILGTNQNQLVQNSTQPVIPTIQPSPTPVNDTANWEKYINQKFGIELKYPEGYQVFEESESKITIAKDQLGSGGFWILNNKDKSFGNYKELKPCKEVYEELKRNPSERPACLDAGKSFGQKEDVANLMLGGFDAVSYYSISTGQGETFRIIQTVKDPLIEIYFFPDTTRQKTFQDQILSTFQFSN